MANFQQKGFLSFLKKNLIAVITPILSLMALVFSVVQSFLAHSRTSIIILFVIGTFFLIVYNVWITIATWESSLDPSKKRRQFSKRFKIPMYIASALILILCWSAFSIAASHKYFGYALFFLKKYEPAVKHFNLLQPSKRDFNSYIRLAECHNKLGNSEQYISTLEDILQNEKILSKFKKIDRLVKEHNLHIGIAETLAFEDFVIGEIPNLRQKALIHAEKARLLIRENPHALSILGYIRSSEASELPDPKTKISVINEVFEEAKKNIEEFFLPKGDYQTLVKFHFWYGKSLANIGEYDLAKKEFADGLTYLDENASPVLKDTFLLKLGHLAIITSNNLESASKYWNQISDQSYLASALMLTGSKLYLEVSDPSKKIDPIERKKKLKDAEYFLSEAKKLGESSYKLFLYLGMLYLSRGDDINAAANLEEVTKMDPMSFLGFYWLGRANYSIKGKLEEAKQAMERAIELDPNNNDAHYWIGRILLDSSDVAGACDEFKKNIEIDRNNPKSYTYLVLSIITLAEKEKEYSDERNSKMEEALKYANEGIEVAKLKEDNSALKSIKYIQPKILNSLAYAYVEREENLSLAIEYIEQALKSDQKNPYYLDTKAWILVKMAEQSEDFTPSQKQKKYDEAEQLLNQCLKSLTAEDNMAKAEAYFHLGYIEKLRGRDDNAREFFLKALKFNPEYDKAKKEMK